MTTSKIIKRILLSGSALLIVACSGGDLVELPTPPVVVDPPPPPVTETPVQDQFGAGFKTAFERDKTAEPVEPVDGDIIPLDKTIDPVDIPDP